MNGLFKNLQFPLPMKFYSFKSGFLRYALYGLITATTAGCAAPVALLANPDKDILLPYIKPAGFKLTSTTIIWVENPSINIEYRYQVPKYMKDVPARPEMVEKVKNEALNLITVLRTEVPFKLLRSLEKSGVQRGDDYRIEMRPVSISHLDNHLGTQVRIDVKVMNREGKSVWTTPVFAKRGYNIVGIDFTNQDTAYTDNTIETLLTRMRKAELLELIS
jgi:hypothetical protein